MINNLFPVTRSAADASPADWDEAAEPIRRENGFDPVQHEQLRDDLQRGRIGLARNRLPVDLDIRDVDDSDLIAGRRAARPARPIRQRRGGARAAARSPSSRSPPASAAAGRPARGGQGGQPVRRCSTAGTAASWRSTSPRPARPSASSATTIPHVVTTSYLTHAAIERHLQADRQLRPRRPGLPLAAAGRSASG